MSSLSKEALAVQDAVSRLAGRLAAAGGAAVALISLWNHAPLWLASLGGCVTILAIRVLAHFGRQALMKSVELDRRAMKIKEQAKP